MAGKILIPGQGQIPNTVEAAVAPEGDLLTMQQAINSMDKIIAFGSQYNPVCNCTNCQFYRNFIKAVGAHHMPPDHKPVPEPVPETVSV